MISRALFNHAPVHLFADRGMNDRVERLQGVRIGKNNVGDCLAI